MNRLFWIVLIFISEVLFAQSNEYSLSRCIELAQKNFSTRISENSVNLAEKELLVSRGSFIPSVTLSNQHSISTGRVLDPTTYQFLTNRTVYDMSASIGGTITLFSGLERLHRTQKAVLNVRSAELDVERTKNNLMMEVTRLFIKILMDKEAIQVCENKIELLVKQEELISKKVEYQTATQGDLMTVQADIMRAQVDCASARNELSLDKISMCELLEIDDWTHFDVVYDEVLMNPRLLWNASDVLASAKSLPQIRQIEIAVEQAKRDEHIASASYWPTIKLNAGYGSTYSNARERATGEGYSFYDQIRDNTNSYVTLSLSIPILGAFTVSHTVRARKYAVHSSELELQKALVSLDKEIKQAIVHVNTAYEKYLLLAKETEKSAEALRQTEAKYVAGAATYYDYQIAVGNLFQAQAERLRARYEYIYRTKIMCFYSGDNLL